MCDHDIKSLVGTAEGITCRKCGKTFPNMASLQADKVTGEGPKTEPVTEEKPRRRRKA